LLLLLYGVHSCSYTATVNHISFQQQINTHRQLHKKCQLLLSVVNVFFFWVKFLCDNYGLNGVIPLHNAFVCVYQRRNKTTCVCSQAGSVGDTLCWNISTI